MNKETIKALAEKVEERPVRRTFSQEEIEKMRGDFVRINLDRHMLMEEITEAREGFKTRMDPLNKEIKTTLTDLRNGFEVTVQKVYLIADQDEGYMQYFTEDGEVVERRKLLPSERQLTLVKGVQS